MASGTFHLVTDLDDTWISGKDSVEHLRLLENALRRVPGAVLTFATRRTLPSALGLLLDTITLYPTHIITGAGMTLYHSLPGGQWVEDAAYSRMVEAKWDEAAARRFMDFWLPKGLQSSKSGWTPRRIVLELDGSVPKNSVLQALKEALDSNGFQADIISSDEHFIDLVPPGVNKGSALHYLETHFGLPHPVVVCGTSTADLEMFGEADLAILMADSPLTFEDRGLPRAKVYRTVAPGPAGIYEALVTEALL